MIEKEKIEAIKQGVDLVALIESKGISLKKNGRSYKGLCPFHDDTNPSLSVNPTTNLWQCFGCSKGGDVITFVQEYDKIDFPGAVAQLIADSSKLIAKPRNLSKKPSTSNRQPLTVKDRKLLNKVISYYQHKKSVSHLDL